MFLNAFNNNFDFVKKTNFLKLVFSVIVCQCAGIVGSLSVGTSVTTWYEPMLKPSFAPPNWVFAPVWTIMYTLMGIALYLIISDSKKSAERNVGLFFFGLQLVLNSLWTFLFFGLQNPPAAFLEIVLMWFCIFATVYYFWRVRKQAAYLLIPYLMWISFALVLNYAFWQINI
ncbi:tryptophan-rich sensory protein [Patescibacteria group bacterium]|nr:tryptophan-rich sensory protein [Patescibacteria group bacterium]